MVRTRHGPRLGIQRSHSSGGPTSRTARPLKQEQPCPDLLTHYLRTTSSPVQITFHQQLFLKDPRKPAQNQLRATVTVTMETIKPVLSPVLRRCLEGCMPLQLSPADAAPLRECCCPARDTVSWEGLQLRPRGAWRHLFQEALPTVAFSVDTCWESGSSSWAQADGLCFPGPPTPHPDMGPDKRSLLSLDTHLF